MADRHTILVCVEDGVVCDVQFCDCCPGVTLEVRTYVDPNVTRTSHLPSQAPAEQIIPEGYHWDETGLYRSTYYEPEDHG